MTRVYGIALFLLLTPLTHSRADTALECGVQVTSQAEISSCVVAQARILDLALDKALGFAKDAAKELDAVTEREAAMPALNAAQGAWLSYRDTHCAYKAALLGGGSGSGIAEGTCRVGMTRQRIEQLMKALQ